MSEKLQHHILAAKIAWFAAYLADMGHIELEVVTNQSRVHLPWLTLVIPEPAE
jgi:hypothetical protein